MATSESVVEASAWREFSGKQIARCPCCGKGFGEVAPGVKVRVRARPDIRAQGSRHLTHKCKGCDREIDLMIVLPN